MNQWEYKIREFIGSGDAFCEFLYQESSDEWQLDALFPLHWTGDANELAEAVTGHANRVCLMFKRQLPFMQSATSSLLL
jgi:hypothetical protein